MATPAKNVSAFSLGDFFAFAFQAHTIVIDNAIAATVPPTPVPTPDPMDMQAYIVRQARKRGVDVEMALFIAEHESRFDPTRQGDYDKAGNPTSFGMWQIHLPSHPDVSIASASDPIWSTQWAMAHMGTPNIWSTWRFRCKWFNYCSK